MLPMNLYCLVISVHGLCYLGLIDVAYESLLLGDICTWSVLSGVH